MEERGEPSSRDLQELERSDPFQAAALQLWQPVLTILKLFKSYKLGIFNKIRSVGGEGGRWKQ